MNEGTKTEKPIAIDLYAGAGGLTLGLKLAGFAVVGAVEVLPVAAQTYVDNHPEVAVFCEDIATLSPYTVMQYLGIQAGELDLMAGCPPCQGFSSMRTLNRGKAVDDPRNDLIRTFGEYVTAFMPKTVMLENVPGLQRDDRFLALLSLLKRLGYFVNHDIHNVSKYGVPQRRRRLIVLASQKEKPTFAPTEEKKVTVAETIKEWANNAGTSGDAMHDLPEKRTDAMKERIAATPKDGGSRTDLPDKYCLPCHKKEKVGFKDVYGRMRWNDVSPTITSGCHNPSKGRFIHPEENRAITLREAALLQSFPKDYKFRGEYGKMQNALMIGNALPPEFIRRHTQVLFELLQDKI